MKLQFETKLGEVHDENICPSLERKQANLPFYLLIKLLHREACLVSLQIRLVSDKKLRRMQRRKYLRIQARVFANWAAYQHHQSARRLLKACAHLSAGPKH